MVSLLCDQRSNGGSAGPQLLRPVQWKLACLYGGRSSKDSAACVGYSTGGEPWVRSLRFGSKLRLSRRARYHHWIDVRKSGRTARLVGYYPTAPEHHRASHLIKTVKRDGIT